MKSFLQYLGKKKAAPTLLETREQDQGRCHNRYSEGDEHRISDMGQLLAPSKRMNIY